MVTSHSQIYIYMVKILIYYLFVTIRGDQQITDF